MRAYISTVFKSGSAAENYFPVITGLRAVAAYMVFLHHTAPDLSILPRTLAEILMVPDTGVIIFFVFSGFLLAYRYNHHYQHQQPQYTHYIIKRFVRIYPLYLLLTLIILFWQQADIYWHWIVNVMLLQSFFDAKLAGIRPAWSLSVQEVFYLLVPFLFTGFAQYPRLIIGLVLTAGAILVLLSQYFSWQPFMPSMFFMLRSTFFGYIFSFYCGYRLAGYYKKHPLSKSQAAQPFLPYTYLGLASTVLCIYLVTINKPTQIAYLGDISATILLLLMNFMYPICIAILLYGLITEMTLLSRLLASWPAQLMGQGSYAFYLMHTGLFFEVIYFHVSKHLPVIFLTLIVISIGVYYFFEKPIYVYLRQRLLTKNMPAAV